MPGRLSIVLVGVKEQLGLPEPMCLLIEKWLNYEENDNMLDIQFQREFLRGIPSERHATRNQKSSIIDWINVKHQ